MWPMDTPNAPSSTRWSALFSGPEAAAAYRRRFLDLEERGPPLLHHRRPDDRLVGTRLHQRGVGGDPVRGEPREVVDRLDEVGLALAVAADERRRPRLQRDVDVGVGAEVVQGQVRDVH